MAFPHTIALDIFNALLEFGIKKIPISLKFSFLVF
jgi:hypothetical protein